MSNKNYICYLLQLQHSRHLVGFSYHTYSKFNFLFNVIFSLHHLFHVIELIVPSIVLNFLTHSSYLCISFFACGMYSLMGTTDIFMLCMDLLSYELLDKYISCHLLQLQHSCLLIGFSFHTYSKFNFLMIIIFTALLFV